MIVAKSEKLDRIFTGLEVQGLVRNNGHSVLGQRFTCPICGTGVTYNNVSMDQPFDYFAHADGSPDCFETDSTSNQHRLLIEITMRSLHNRIREVTGEPVDIDVERWIGMRENFVIGDVRVTSPIQVAAEVFYKSNLLALGRRFNTMFANGYQTYLVFHRDGRHDVDRVEQYLHRVAPLRVGRFNPDNLELTLGDLFSKEQIKLTQSNLDRLPNYIAKSY